MRFRNAVRLLIDNFGNVYKLLLFRVVVNVLFLSLAYVVVTLGLHVVYTSAEAEAIGELIGEFPDAIISGKTAFLESFSENFTRAIADFLIMLGTNVGSIVGSLIGVCLLYLAARFLNGTAVFAMGDVINDKMEAYSRTKFASAYFKHIGKSVLYQIIYVPLCFIYDVLCLLACWFFFFYTPSFLPSWGIMTFFVGVALSLTAFLCLEALKMTFISAWMPAVIADEKPVAKAFAETFKRFHGFASRFSCFLITLYLIVALNVAFCICTVGSMLLITVPMSYLLLLCIQFVYYYEDEGKKFFLSFRKISGADGKPEGMGD